ncbi:MAG: hypothetical protein HOV96_30490 [Nonomuraea sp.]|nr:hypothetical protein [Nonomuraea sp.]
MITFIVFALAALSAVEVVLGLLLLGWAAVELGAFLRRHPDTAARGLRELAAGARQFWPAANVASRFVGRRVIRWRRRQPHERGPRVLRAGRAYAAAAGRVRRHGPDTPRRRADGSTTTRPRTARRTRARG